MWCAMMTLSTIAVLLSVVCNVVSNPLPFSVGNGGDFSIMTLADDDEVIVAGRSAGRNVIYRLSANLSVLDDVTTSGTVRGLSLTNGGQYVTVCVNTGRSCSVYNVTNFNDTLGSVVLSGNAASEDDPVAMFPGEAEGDVYVGTAAVTSGQYPMMLGQYSITGGSIMNDRTRDYDVSTSLLSERIFHTGFVIDDYSYYIVGDGGNDIRILRVCNQSIDQSIDVGSVDSQLFRALYEVELICGGGAAFASASVVVTPANNTLVLAVRPSGDTGGTTSRVCTYSISDINTAMDNSLTECAAGEDRSTVWDGNVHNNVQNFCGSPTASVCNLLISASAGLDIEALDGGSLTSTPVVNEGLTQFTSSVIIQVEGELLMFIGTNDGRLLKYIFNNINSVVLYLIDRTITTSRIISLQWSLGSDYVYGLTSEQVIPILVEDCQSSRDCTSCAASPDPLCGWCSIEKKCSRRSECSNNAGTRRWIQEEDMCIKNFAISPITLPVEEAGFQFAISADLIPPPLTDENFYCVFGDLGSSVVEGNLSSMVNFTDLTCNYSFTVDQFSNESTDTIVVDFSLRSNISNINFITIIDGFSFFNCSTHTNCRSCLSSDNLCGWCLYDKKCTSSIVQCEGVPEWITRDNTSSSCPLILNSNATNGYQQPVGVQISRNLSVNAINLPPPIDDYRYECVIQYDGSEVVLQAEYTGADGLECIPSANDFSNFEYVNDGMVVVRWTGPNVVYDLENEVDRLNVILYNCSALAGGCSSCLSVSNTLMLDCGWCNNLTSCVIMESCSDGSTFTTIISTCPLPQITMVNPNSGPYQGGTDVTISGTDLGVVVDDIVFILIGGAPCMINRDSYQPGERFRCTTTEHTILSPSYPSLIVIVIKHFGTTAFTSLPNGFRYANVSITGFYPEVIPISGNRMITITGINFDISNTSLVTVELAETACHIKSISHDSLQCVAGERRRRCAGPVVLRIDNAEIMSEDNFEYVDNPQVFSLRNNEVIKSGGVDLIFKGKQLNIIPTDLVIEIIDRFTGDSVMNYTTQCKNEVHNNDSITLSRLPYEHRKKLSCPFPGISSELFDGLKNGLLNLTYSLVATGIPNLSDLHLRPPLQLTVVDDPQFENFGTVKYSSDLLVKITGSLRGVQCNAIPCDTLMVIVGGVQGAECQIVKVTPFSLLCMPLPLTGTMPVTVHVGQYLNYTVGNIDYGTMDEGDKES